MELAGVTSNDIRLFCLTLSLRPQRVGERNVGRRSRLWALVRALLPDLSLDEASKIVQEMLGSDSKEYDEGSSANKGLLLECLRELDSDEQRTTFSSLKSKLEDDAFKAECKKQIRQGFNLENTFVV